LHKVINRWIKGILNHGYLGFYCWYHSVIVIGIIVYFLLKKFVALVINAIVGVIVLFLLNLFHVMQLFGGSDLPIDWITILISAIGGLVGMVIVIILHLAGVVL
jgi:hypothetical protein